MIFIALGTQKFQLNRLLQEVDNLIAQGDIQEEVFAQIGNSDYIPQNFSYESFLPKAVFEQKIADCSLLITHSGVGTIVAGLKNSKPVLVYPRLNKFAEHVDDHQLQIAKSFQQQNYVLLCSENDSLKERIDVCRTFPFRPYQSQRSLAVQTVRDYLATIK